MTGLYTHTPTGHCHLMVSDGFIKIQQSVWAQAYCGHNWVVQWAVFMRLCVAQREGEKKIKLSKLASFFMQTVLDPAWVEDLKRCRGVVHSEQDNICPHLPRTQALSPWRAWVRGYQVLSGPPTKSLGTRLALSRPLTIIPCPGMYSLTRTWLGSWPSKTLREATLLPQTLNHCTWKKHHVIMVI